jgi:hypothetical protein
MSSLHIWAHTDHILTLGRTDLKTKDMHIIINPNHRNMEDNIAKHNFEGKTLEL